MQILKYVLFFSAMVIQTQVYAGIDDESAVVQTTVAPKEFLHQIKHLSELDEFATRVISDLRRPVDPSKVLVVFDLDGTLTVERDPTHSRGNLVMSPNALSIATKFTKQGFHTYISSAWDVFDETLTRVFMGGLSESFGIYPDTKMESKSFAMSTLDGKQVELQSVRRGRVISVRDPKICPRFYRQKALAPLVGLSPEEIEKIQDVIFVDDSRGNIEFFKHDVRRFGLYHHEGVQIHYFEYNPS